MFWEGALGFAVFVFCAGALIPVWLFATHQVSLREAVGVCGVRFICRDGLWGVSKEAGDGRSWPAYDASMLFLQPHETELIGRWIFCDGRMVEDAVAQRIHALISSELTLVSVSGDGWSRLYLDPKDGRRWEFTFPSSYLQGGGPPCLRLVSSHESAVSIDHESSLPL